MSTTTNTGLNQPAYNSTSPTWDQPLNFNETILDAVLGNTTSVAMPTGASATTTLTGPTSTGSLGQTQAMRITLTGSLSANQILQFPSGVAGKWIIYNTTSGSFSVTVSSAGGGTAVSAPQGYNVSIYSDGTNIRYTDDGLTNNFATLTVLGNTYLATTSGNVGIGTSSPSVKLDIQNTATAVLRVYNLTATNGVLLTQDTSGNSVLNNQGNGYLLFGTNNTERMRIDSSGNVGIGRTPVFPLDISATTGIIRLTSSTGTNYAQLQAVNGSGTARFGVEGSGGNNIVAGSSAYSAVVSQAGAYSLHLGTNNTVQATIDSSGNVGIGTVSPSTLLTVNGVVTATSYTGAGTGLTGIVTSNVAGTGITVSGSTGAVTISNTGVTSNVAGTGITVSGSTGAVTISNSGVTSITGTASQITASASTGGVTLSLPSTINVNTSGNAANVTGTVAVANGGTGLTSTPANGAIDIGNGTNFTRSTITAGSGITVTNGAGSITIANSSPGTVVGTTWTDYTGSRSLGTTYTNSTGKLIFISVYTGYQTSGITVTVNGLLIFSNSWGGSGFASTAFSAIPPGATYSVSGGILGTWYECV